MTDIDYAHFDDSKVRQFLSDLDINIKKIGRTSNDFMVLLNAIVFKDVIRHFETESGPAGRWQAWSARYAKKRKGGKILQDTGKLRNAFKPTNFRKDDNGIVWFNDAKTKKGFPYAFAHDTGGPKLPKRSFMWLSNDAIKQIESDTLEFLLGN